MDVRLSADGLRYRLSCRDAQAVARGERITQAVASPASGLPTWSLGQTGGEGRLDGLHLTLAAGAIDALLALGRDKKGLRLTIDGTAVTVCIDVRDPEWGMT